MSSSPPLSLSRSRGLSEKLLEADTRQCLPIAGLETLVLGRPQRFRLHVLAHIMTPCFRTGIPSV